MKLSVIVPVYNTEKYINRCVNSLINQSYKDIEIILVDDGSPDNCPKICDDFAQKYDFIHVIHKKNGGLSSARNAGLDIATGDYIGFVDSDDFIHKDFYKILIKECEKNQCDISMASFLKFTNKIPTDFEFKTYESQVYNSNEIIVSDYVKMKHVFQTNVWLKIYKREIFQSLRFDENIPYLEDVHLKPEIMLKSKKFVVIDLALYYYFCDNPTSLVATRKNKKHSNISVDIHVNKVLAENNIENIQIITENKFFSVIYTISKMASYYDEEQLEKSRIEILDYYKDKLKNKKFIFLYNVLKNKKYTILRYICFLTFDLYKKVIKWKY